MKDQLGAMPRTGTTSLPPDSLSQSSQKTCPDSRSGRKTLHLVTKVEENITLQRNNGSVMCCGSHVTVHLDPAILALHFLGKATHTTIQSIGVGLKFSDMARKLLVMRCLDT